jgi:hypothetical protein
MSRAREFADLAGSADAGGLTGRNLIINGAMNVAQRQTSKQIVGSSADLVCDRFEVSISSDATVTASQDTNVPSGQGFTKSTKFVVNTADTSLSSAQHNLFQQKIEGFVGQHLMWGTSDAKPVSVSFWIRSSLTGSFTYYLLDGNANSQSYVAPFTIDTADTWEYKTIKIPGPTTGGNTDFPQGSSRMLYTGFSLGVGSGHQTSTVNAWHDPSGTWAGARSSDVSLVGTANATMYITGWQLEVGEQATPFEHRSFGEELALCQRYYQVHSDIHMAHYVNAAFRRAETYVPLPVEMRAAPTRTVLSTGSASNIRSATNTYSGFVFGVNKHSVVLSMESNGSGYMYIYDRKEELDAEL